jgi:hypothetical protein
MERKREKTRERVRENEQQQQQQWTYSDETAITCHDDVINDVISCLLLVSSHGVFRNSNVGDSACHELENLIYDDDRERYLQYSDPFF